jgi:hypothetical protein
MKIYSYGYDSMKVVSQLAQAVTCLLLTRDRWHECRLIERLYTWEGGGCSFLSRYQFIMEKHFQTEESCLQECDKRFGGMYSLYYQG